MHSWDTTSGQPSLWHGHTDTVTDVVPLSDGRLVSSSMDGTLRVWTSAGVVERTLGPADNLIFHMLLAPSGAIVTVGNGGEARLWDVATGAHRRFPGAAARDPSWSADGRLVLNTASGPQLWHVTTWQRRRLEELAGPDDAEGMYAAGVATDVVAGIDPRGQVRIWRDDLPHGPSALAAWLRGLTAAKIEDGDVAGPLPQ